MSMKKRPNPATAHDTITTRRSPDNIRSSALVRGRSTQFMANPCRWPQRPCPETRLHCRHFRGRYSFASSLFVCFGHFQRINFKGSIISYQQINNTNPRANCSSFASSLFVFFGHFQQTNFKGSIISHQQINDTNLRTNCYSFASSLFVFFGNFQQISFKESIISYEQINDTNHRATLLLFCNCYSQEQQSAL